MKYLPHHYLPAIQVLLQFLEHTSKAVQCIYKYTLTCILIFFLFFLLIFNCTIIAVWFLPYINLKEPYILWKIYLSPMYTSSFQIFKTVIHKKEMKLLFHGCGYLCPVPECHNHFNSIMCASEHLCFSLLFWFCYSGLFLASLACLIFQINFRIISLDMWSFLLLYLSTNCHCLYV